MGKPSKSHRKKHFSRYNPLTQPPPSPSKPQPLRLPTAEEYKICELSVENRKLYEELQNRNQQIDLLQQSNLY